MQLEKFKQSSPLTIVNRVNEMERPLPSFVVHVLFTVLQRSLITDQYTFGIYLPLLM